MFEETFGPIAPVMTYEDLDEVIGIANDTEFDWHRISSLMIIEQV